MIIEEINVMNQQTEEDWCVFCDKEDGCGSCDSLDWTCGTCDDAEDTGIK